MNRYSVLTGMVMLLAIGSTTGCSCGSTSPIDCVDDGDCAAGVCVDGSCVQCRGNEDCNVSGRCVNHECVPRAQCDSSADCDEGFCVNSLCMDCLDDGDCPEGQRCRDRVCVTVEVEECDGNASCNNRGTCDDSTGEIVCYCDQGWAGERCERCALGYTDYGDGECRPADPCADDTTCAEQHRACENDQGTAVCGDCLAGYHEEEGVCVEDVACGPNTCNGRGTCDDAGGVPVCTCDAGYAGDHCESCDDGYTDYGDGECRPSNPCAIDVACAEQHRECVNDQGTAVCGDCLAGYHDLDGACIEDVTCGPNTCNGRGICDDAGGVPVCTCDTGYAGDHCESCAQGYHQDGLGSCVADEHCDPSSCNGHGSCDDSTGVVTCTCTGGFTGPYCGQCGGCAIGDTCHAADTLDPDNPCQSCQPGISAGDWSPVDDDTPCVDDDVCNGEETCQAGVCTDGQDLNCNDDDDPCTDDLCDPQTGCYWEFNTEPCDDSNPRTTDDSCDGAGTCRGLVDLDQDGVADYGYAAVCASDETEACNDNCIGVANADQADLDGNGVGDACDLGTVAGQYIGGHAWSPDSTRIALIQCAAGQGYACDLIVADPDLTHAQIIHDLVDSGGLYGWQDGWIYFRRYAVSGLPSAYAGDGEVWRIMPDGNGLSQVTNTLSNGIKAYDYPSYANIGTVRWGKIIPGTNWIYIKAHDGNGWYRTYRCNADSCDEPGEVVGISGDYGWGSGLSQAGDRLYFGDSWDHDQPMTWISTALDGSDPVTLVHPLQSLSCFVGSPDGQTVAYVEERGARVLRLVDADGTDDRALLGDGTELMITFWQDGANRSGVMENDIWSPGSRYLLFGSDRAGDFHIFRIGSDGTGLVQMTDGAYHDFGPSFSPDGRSFSYYRLPVGYDDSSSPYPTNLVVEPTCLDFHDWPNSILVTGGTLAGQALDPAAPAIRVGPSASISGTIETQIANMAGESGWVFPVCGTPSWGDPASSYWTQNSWFHLGTGAQTFNVNLTAPDTPGRYYIFMAGSYEMDCGDVLSLTRWQDPPEIWGDGNDVADWELAEALQARKHGKVCARFEVPGMGTWKIAAAAVEVIVE